MGLPKKCIMLTDVYNHQMDNIFQYVLLIIKGWRRTIIIKEMHRNKTPISKIHDQDTIVAYEVYPEENFPIAVILLHFWYQKRVKVGCKCQIG